MIFSRSRRRTVGAAHPFSRPGLRRRSLRFGGGCESIHPGSRAAGSFGGTSGRGSAFEQGKVLDVEGGIDDVHPRRKSRSGLASSPWICSKTRIGLSSRLVIDRLRVRPALDLPAEVAFRYGFRKEALISPGGLLVRDRRRGNPLPLGKRSRPCAFVRRDRRRRDFESLEIVLPDRVVKFSLIHNRGPDDSIVVGNPRRSQCPAPRSWPRFSSDRFPPTAFRSFPASDAPLTIEEWHDRRSMLAERSRDLTIMRRILLRCRDLAAAGLAVGLSPWDIRRCRDDAS